MLKRIDLYIIKKYLGTFILSIVLIIAISIVVDVSEKIDEFMENNAPLGSIIFDYYLNFIPYFVNLFTPLFAFVSVIFFTSKMAYNSEITAILAGGVSFNRMLRPYVISSILIGILSFVLGGYVIPPANEVRLDFEDKYIGGISNAVLHPIHPSFFILTAALAKDTRTLPVNSGFESNFKENSTLLMLFSPVTPVRITEPP
jgi:lipopolysaccharide export system permease protein